jgi:hypothetical protein
VVDTVGLKSWVLKSSKSRSEMADSRIIRNLRRRWSASDSGEVFVIVLGRTGDSALLDSDCSRLLLKVIGWMLLVFCVCDGDFMVVDKSFLWRICGLRKTNRLCERPLVPFFERVFMIERSVKHHITIFWVIRWSCEVYLKKSEVYLRVRHNITTSFKTSSWNIFVRKNSADSILG